MNDEQFDKLYLKLHEYMQKEFGEIRAELAVNNKRVDRVYEIVDGIAKRLDTDDHERAAMLASLTRHKGWISQLAEQNGAKLQPRL